MWNISSIAARSLGNGKRFWTSSSREMPVDQTSDLIVYSRPDRRSGWAGDQQNAPRTASHLAAASRERLALTAM